jgi:DNA (cytosine-5)-methyltransferase 1
LSAIDLFAGPGGWSVACQNLGIEETGIEFDASACDTRRAAGHKTVEADVTTLEPQWYPADGLIASPPCQTFSTAGKGEGRRKLPLVLEAIRCGGHFPDPYKDGKTELVVEPMRWIDTMARRGYPYRWIAMEQVPTVLPVWEAYAQRLRELSYFVWVGKLHAEQYGVPQTRTRAFLLANLDWEMAPPVPTHSRYYPRSPEKLDEGVQPWVSMATALGWGMDARPSMTVCAGGTRTGGAEVFGNGARTGMRREFEAGHWAHRRPSTSINCDPRVAQPGRHDPAVSGSQYGPETIRVTVQEGGILQSFPADYPWQGTKTKQFEQVGNAVPPGLAEAVLRVVARQVS